MDSLPFAYQIPVKIGLILVFLVAPFAVWLVALGWEPVSKRPDDAANRQSAL
jgi:hypothetical protein